MSETRFGREREQRIMMDWEDGESIVDIARSEGVPVPPVARVVRQRKERAIREATGKSNLITLDDVEDAQEKITPSEGETMDGRRGYAVTLTRETEVVVLADNAEEARRAARRREGEDKAVPPGDLGELTDVHVRDNALKELTDENGVVQREEKRLR